MRRAPSFPASACRRHARRCSRRAARHSLTAPGSTAFYTGVRAEESRMTVDGLNIGNPPGGGQPPTYVADVGNAQEISFTASGGLGEQETAGLVMNLVPKTGGNRNSGAIFFTGTGEKLES